MMASILNPFAKKHPTLDWQLLKSKQKQVPNLYRAAVHGGWLICGEDYSGLVFVPDANHEWDGDSYPIFEK